MIFRSGSATSSSVFGGILTAAVLVMTMPLTAQPRNASPPATISGIVHWDGGGQTHGLRVELKNAGGWQTTWTDVRPDGTFQAATGGPVGQQYILRVRDSRGAIIYDDIVRQQSEPWEICLHAPSKERPVEGTISAQELLAEPPKKALRQFEKAQKAVRKGTSNVPYGICAPRLRFTPALSKRTTAWE